MTPPPQWLARLLYIIAAFCFLFAALTQAGGQVFHADAQAWFYGGWAALAFGLAAS